MLFERDGAHINSFRRSLDIVGEASGGRPIYSEADELSNAAAVANPEWVRVRQSSGRMGIRADAAVFMGGSRAAANREAE
jgi:hypothetical protein